jgi:hypothetical protein
MKPMAQAVGCNRSFQEAPKETKQESEFKPAAKLIPWPACVL